MLKKLLPGFYHCNANPSMIVHKILFFDKSAKYLNIYT
jgi:hypothetical protein